MVYSKTEFTIPLKQKWKQVLQNNQNENKDFESNTEALFEFCLHLNIRCILTLLHIQCTTGSIDQLPPRYNLHIISIVIIIHFIISIIIITIIITIII